MTPGVRRLATAGNHTAASRVPLTGFDRSVVRLSPMPPLRPRERPHGPSPMEVWRAFEDEDLWSCTYCDAPLGGMVVGEADHVVPLSAGGAHDLHNLVPACRRCNLGKSARSAQVWLTELAGQM